MSSNAQILVAEDNDFVRMQIVKFLQDDGYEVKEAIDGNTAIQVVENENIDFCVVDVRMEPLNGFDFIRSIRGRGMDTPIILVTGDDASDILETAGEWGVSAVLIKPVEKERLLKAVERGLRSAQKRTNNDAF
jgi:CheY-like chemotaxis protein